MNWRPILIYVAGILLLAGMVHLTLVRSVPAQEAEAPLGVHPHGSQTHWYDPRCCNLHDCARVEMRIEADHYVWDSWRWPGVTMRVPVTGQPGTEVLPSQDGGYHGCEVRRSSGPHARCVYVPPAM